MTMKRLGAIIAGGQSRRFGADKGAALLGGVALIDHVRAALEPQVDTVIIVGRTWRGLTSIDDAPSPLLGPLGGLNAALRYAEAHGYSEVLTTGCDTLPIPLHLTTLLLNAPAVIADHYLIGRWPTHLNSVLHAYLMDSDDHSMRGWMRTCAAQQVVVPELLYNLNTPADLAAYALSSSLVARP